MNSCDSMEIKTFYPNKLLVIIELSVFLISSVIEFSSDELGIKILFALIIFAVVSELFFGIKSITISNKEVSINSPLRKKIIYIQDIKKITHGDRDSYDKIKVIFNDGHIYEFLRGFSYQKKDVNRIINTMQEARRLLPPINMIESNEIRKVKPAITNTRNWKQTWKNQFNQLHDSKLLVSKKGYYVLNSLDLNDIQSTNYNKKSVEILGFIRTINYTFYMTQESFESGNPKWIYIIP